MGKDRLIDRSRGDGLGWFWRLYRLRRNTKHRLVRSICTYLMCRSAHRHGGYVGPGAEFDAPPVLPHGLHGVFISRYAVVGAGCRIYQNVTIGEVDGKAPVIGPDCLIGAGAVLVGEIRVGRGVRVGAGAVVCQDVPDGSTVVAPPPRILVKEAEGMKYEEASTARAWREVDLEAVAHNAAWLQGRMGSGCRLMAVVKADAYGHGAGSVAKYLAERGVRAFAVACLAEGIALRRQGMEGLILILGCTPPEEAAELARWGLTQCVADEAHGRALSAAGVPLQVHLALDTGMHRLGIPAEDRGAIARTRALPNLRFTGTFSHLCVSDSVSPEDRAFTRAQLDRFYGAAAWMAAAGLDPGAVHIQASCGILTLPPQPCAWARAGIALYGVYSRAEDRPAVDPLRPALSLRARVAALRTVPAGEGAGYGLAFRAERDTRLAVVTIGYADGLPRMLAQAGGEVLLRGVRCPMAGRMCMDQLLVDVTGVPRAAPGDVVTLIGRDGGAELRAEEVAGRCGTITNELLSRLGSRLPIRFWP